MATVRYQRSTSGKFDDHELDEAQRLCAEAFELVGPTESRVSQLWLGPIHIDVLLAAATRAQAQGNTADAEQKRNEAKSRLEDYEELVVVCQSKRFTSEAKRLATQMSDML
jgi:hypothetical protein